MDCEVSAFVSVSDYRIGIEYPKDMVCEDITSGASLSTYGVHRYNTEHSDNMSAV